jgi:hypothetical protein
LFSSYFPFGAASRYRTIASRSNNSKLAHSLYISDACALHVVLFLLMSFLQAFERPREQLNVPHLHPFAFIHSIMTVTQLACVQDHLPSQPPPSKPIPVAMKQHALPDGAARLSVSHSQPGNFRPSMDPLWEDPNDVLHDHHHHPFQQQQQQMSLHEYALAVGCQEPVNPDSGTRSRTHSLPPAVHPPHVMKSSSTAAISYAHAARRSSEHHDNASTGHGQYRRNSLSHRSSACDYSSAASSVVMSSIPAPALNPVMEVQYQDDMHWERLALNSASSLPAPVPEFPLQGYMQNNYHYYFSWAQPQDYYGQSQPSSRASAQPHHGSDGYGVSWTTNAAHASSKYRVAHEHLFTTSDPQSDRLSEFVSKMVFVIFWHGSDAFDNILMALKMHSRASVGEIILQQANTPLASAFSATPEFVKYTKYLLQTMQISCSTALLSLFYLYRLRPRVEHMFVPGTFADAHRQNSGDPNENRYQYRRDPKLEYRLFTIAVVLANKYLDDNSYSNKAWSDVTGLELRKINIMEQEFMKYIDYNLVVEEREYVAWVNWLETYIGSVMAPAAQNFVFEPVRPFASYVQQRRCSLPVTPLYHVKHVHAGKISSF